MRALWGDPVASFEGEFVSFSQVKCNPRPVHGAELPILVGGQSPAAARRAGRLGQGFIPMGDTPEEITQLRKHMEQAATDAGRDPSQIEITQLGPADPDVARAYADAGVTRMLVSASQPDLESARKAMESFSNAVID